MSRIASPGAIEGAEQRATALDPRFETVEANLDTALDLAANWQTTYLSASPRERPQLNQAIVFILTD